MNTQIPTTMKFFKAIFMMMKIHFFASILLVLANVVGILSFSTSTVITLIVWVPLVLTILSLPGLMVTYLAVVIIDHKMSQRMQRRAAKAEAKAQKTAQIAVIESAQESLATV